MLKSLAGATGLEPATFGVTGRRFRVGSSTKTACDSTPAPGNNAPKTGDSTPGVEPPRGPLSKLLRWWRDFAAATERLALARSRLGRAPATLPLFRMRKPATTIGQKAT